MFKDKLVKALMDAGYLESAMRLHNWDECDAPAIEFFKKAATNPDKAADADLGEEIEKLVERHAQKNKRAERKEGHKLLGKNEKKPAPMPKGWGKEDIRPGSMQRKPTAQQNMYNKPKK